MKYKRYRTNIGPGSPAVVINVKLGKYTNFRDYNKAFINKTVDITLDNNLKIYVYEEANPSNIYQNHVMFHFPELAATWQGYGPTNAYWWITPAPFNVNKFWDSLNAV